MKIAGKRKEQNIDFHASEKNLLTGARFNSELHKSFPNSGKFIKKGVYHYKTHDEANGAWEQALIEAVKKQNKL